eukprot:6994919-Prymnesium_polylepis.1
MRHGRTRHANRARGKARERPTLRSVPSCSLQQGAGGWVARGLKARAPLVQPTCVHAVRGVLECSNEIVPIRKEDSSAPRARTKILSIHQS